jgi:hypothetical protein
VVEEAAAVVEEAAVLASPLHRPRPAPSPLRRAPPRPEPTPPRPVPPLGRSALRVRGSERGGLGTAAG